MVWQQFHKSLSVIINRPSLCWRRIRTYKGVTQQKLN